MRCPRCKKEHTGELKTCDSCLEYFKQYRLYHKEERKEYDKQYYQDNKDKIKEQAKEWGENHPERYKELHLKSSRKHQEKYPLKRKAQSCIHSVVSDGKIPPAKDLICKECGNSAKEYHHHLGYEREHWMDVIPLCKKCHRDRHNKEGDLMKGMSRGNTPSFKLPNIIFI